MANVYCAGPLFNDPERLEMAELAAVLEANGHKTFLPQRDGLEFADILPALSACGLGSEEAENVIRRAIFSLDTYKVLHWADVVVANLNGRVPDEGTVVEATLAWVAGKALVLFKNDARTLLNGADNPMVLGLGDFKTIRLVSQMPGAVLQALEESRQSRKDGIYALGSAIEKAKVGAMNTADTAALLMSLVKAQSK